MSDLAIENAGIQEISATELPAIGANGKLNGAENAIFKRHRRALRAYLDSLNSPHCAQVDDYIGRLQTALATLSRDRLVEIGEALLRAYRNDKQVFTLGNGGSSSTASHMAADLAKNTIGANMKRFRIASLADNGSIMTALANDLDYESVFSEQLVNVICPGDVLIAISGSGNSANVLKAVRYARRQSAEIIGLLGFDGGEAARLVDIPVIVHSTDYGIIEDVHLAINHMLVEYFREHLAESRPWIG
jgi:D-sedoheptulose 7-phosphate isomerase